MLKTLIANLLSCLQKPLDIASITGSEILPSPCCFVASWQKQILGEKKKLETSSLVNRELQSSPLKCCECTHWRVAARYDFEVTGDERDLRRDSADDAGDLERERGFVVLPDEVCGELVDGLRFDLADGAEDLERELVVLQGEATV